MHIEMSLHQRSMHIMKDGLEPFHLVGIARCASRGIIRTFGEQMSLYKNFHMVPLHRKPFQAEKK
jgi:hypothetical protein